MPTYNHFYAIDELIAVKWRLFRWCPSFTPAASNFVTKY